MGIEPTSKAWEAFVLPLNYTRGSETGTAFACILPGTYFTSSYFPANLTAQRGIDGELPWRIRTTTQPPLGLSNQRRGCTVILRP